MSLLTPAELFQRVTGEVRKDAENDERCIEWACRMLWSEASHHINKATLANFNNGVFRPHTFHLSVFEYKSIDAALRAKISARINERANRLGWAFTVGEIKPDGWLCVELRALPTEPVPPIYT